MTAIRRLIRRGALVGLLAALVLVGINALISYRTSGQLYTSSELVDHTHVVIHELNAIRADLLYVETSQRGYLLTGDEAFLRPYRTVIKGIDGRVDEVARLTMDNPQQQDRIGQLRDVVQARLKLLEENVGLPSGGKSTSARDAALSRGRKAMDDIESVVADMQGAEASLLISRVDQTRKSYRRTITGLLSATVLAAVVLVVTYCLIRRDLSARQAKEDQARETARFTRLLLDSSGEGVCGVDSAGNFTFINATGANLLGYEPDQLLGKNLHAISHHTHADGTPYLELESPIYEVIQSRQRGRRIDTEVFWSKNGTSFPVEYAAFPMREDGAAVGAVVSFSDISDRKRAEEAKAERAATDALRADVGEALAHPGSSRDVLRRCAESLVKHLNAAFARVWTLNDAEGVLELEASAGLYTHLDGPHGRIKVGEFKIGRIASRRRPHLTNDVQHDPEVSDHAWAKREGMVAFAGYPLTVDGRLYGVVALFAKQALADAMLTELHPLADLIAQYVQRKRAEEDLKFATHAAEAANEAKSTFLANMSHELRTPLNAVILYSELLQEEAEDKGLDEFLPDLEKIRSAGRHLLGLINNILDLSKIEAGKMDLFLETFDLGEVVADVAATVRPLFEKRHNKLVSMGATSAGAMLADQTKVRQILFNLLSNASKFTDKGTIDLTVTRHCHETGEEIEFRVSDSGIGMTAEQMGKLFQPFSQADASTTRKFGGTGLGLTIVKRFCELMGGRIEVESAIGEGTTFTAWLPAAVATPATDAVSYVGSSVGDGTLGGLTVLVVDDDPNARELLTRVLFKEGYRVLAAPDGKSGLEIAVAELPDVIVLDVMMPGMDGWAVLSAIKQDPKLADIPVVLHTMVDNKNLGYALGAADYLTKPVDRERLVSVLNKYRTRAAADPILIVEDDVDIRQAVVRALGNAGWDVAEAENGRVALSRLVEKKPAAVILDLMMPEMDGFDFLDEVRKKPEWVDIPIVVLTAKELTAEDRARLNGHVEKVIQKGSMDRDGILLEVRRLVAVYARRTTTVVSPEIKTAPDGGIEDIGSENSTQPESTDAKNTDC